MHKNLDNEPASVTDVELPLVVAPWVDSETGELLPHRVPALDDALQDIATRAEAEGDWYEP